MKGLLIVACLFVTVLMFSAGSANAMQLFGRWLDLNMTYRLDAGCLQTSHDNLLNMTYTRSDAIYRAIQIWATWFPEMTWRPVSSDERVTFTCLSEASIPNAAGTISSTICYGSNPFTNCNVESGTAVFDFKSNAILITTHEIGHTLGLIDGTGGIMTYQGPVDAEFGVTLPTAEQVNELCTTYSLPARDLSTRATPIGSPFGQTVTVVVSKDGRWITDAEVTLNGVGTLHTTGDPAVATFTNIPPGTYTVTANNGEYQNSATATVSTAPIFLTITLDNGVPVPEFPTPIIMLVIAFGAIVIMRRSRKTST